MRRLVLTFLLIGVLGTSPVLAQQRGHMVATPDALKWGEPAALPGARLAVVQGDPSKEGRPPLLRGVVAQTPANMILEVRA